MTVDGHQRAAPGVWAIGDITGQGAFTHMSMYQAGIAVADILGQPHHEAETHAVPRVTFTDPEIGSVGLTEAQARDRGHDVKVGKFPLVANGRAIIHGETQGFFKMVADAGTGQLLGAHLVGVQATELIGEPALAQLFEGDAWEVGRNVHPHPTLSEALGETAMAVDGAAINI